MEEHIVTDNHLKGIIDVAAGRKPADTVLKNARIINVVSHEIYEGDVAIHQDRIAGIGDYDGKTTYDLKGRYVCPGFIDAHVHIESSLLSVPEFARIVVAHGTTAVVADPHEFANVMGAEGIAFVLRSAQFAPIDVFITLSSCVPASPLESTGVALGAEDLESFLANKWVLGLAEMMNYPGVINAQEDVLKKLAIAAGRIIDGHAPSLSGKGLTAYAAAGIMSDHECVDTEEAAEKLRRGMYIMIREGSQTRNLKALLPLIKNETASHFMFCTDDKDVEDLLEEGQIDHMVRTAIAEGLDPILAVRLASYNTARYFGLKQRGAIQPGYRAELTVLDDLKHCRVTEVFRRGELVAQNGVCLAPRDSMEQKVPLRSTIDVHWMKSEDFEIAAPEGTSDAAPPNIHVIYARENRIDTERGIEPAVVRDGLLVADPDRDLAKIVVIDRHRASGEIGHGFVKGFGLKGGAIASTVAHDAHNMIVVGMSDDDMLAAAIHLIKLHGGLAIVHEGRVLADVPLPIAGLVSNEPAERVAQQLHELSAAAKQLDCPFEQPFMALAFLSLSVIGKLKVTNQGLIDVEKFATIPLIAG